MLNSKILVVDDNIICRELLKDLLEDFGYEVDIAVNGKEAVNAVEHFKYDIVFMDCQMPIMDGFEAARMIRKQEQQIPEQKKNIIIAMTATITDNFTEDSSNAGMDDYIPKPYNKDHISNILKKYCFSEDETEGKTPVSTNCLDMQIIDSLKSRKKAGKPTLLARLILLFNDDSPNQIKTIREALTNTDFDQGRIAAHSFKNSSAELGAMQLSRYCEQLEKQFKAEPSDLSDSLELVNIIEKEYKVVNQELNNLANNL